MSIDHFDPAIHQTLHESSHVSVYCEGSLSRNGTEHEDKYRRMQVTRRLFLGWVFLGIRTGVRYLVREMEASREFFGGGIESGRHLHDTKF